MNKNVSTYIKLWLILFNFIAIYSIRAKQSGTQNAKTGHRHQSAGPDQKSKGWKQKPMAKPKNTITEYRSYYLPMQFPVLLLSGDYWKISDVPSGRLHFHNCLEIGVCHSHSGYIEIFGEQVLFQEGDVTVIPKNIPHTTYSMPGTESHWSYIYLDPRELFRHLLPATWQNYDLTGYPLNGFKPILNREEYPQVHALAQSVIRELEEQKPSFQISAKGLLLSLYIEIYRIQSFAKNGGGHC